MCGGGSRCGDGVDGDGEDVKRGVLQLSHGRVPHGMLSFVIQAHCVLITLISHRLSGSKLL